MAKRQVMIAEPYNSYEMGSLGKASYMLLRQDEFPLDYTAKDVLLSVDHDRCYQWDYKHADACWKKHVDRYFEQWVVSAFPEKIMDFMRELTKADEAHPGVKWTGFRALGTVNRSNGYPVYSMQLFAKVSKGTKVYSGQAAPNVKGFMVRRMDGKLVYGDHECVDPFGWPTRYRAGR